MSNSNNNNRRPPLPPLLPGQAYSSGYTSPQQGSLVSNGESSSSSFTSAASSNGPKTPSPTLPIHAITGPATNIVSYDAMNHQNPDMYYPQHMSGGQPAPPQTVTSNNLASYQHTPHLMQPGPTNYSNPNPYGQYHQYANGLTSPSAAQPVSNPMGAPPAVLPLPGVGGQASIANHYAGFDTTGQNPPPGMKPRVTATLWEDEGSLCFQVEARGICVARREDNHMINGTKLLNVAGMTRGRRDGILKSEKVRHVVKIGPMHLKGVWIPYERALDFANKEKITEMLYPLFVHNIGALLYHPTNQTRTSQVMAAAERRKQEQNQIRPPPPPPPGLPSIQQHQQMAMSGSQPPLPSHGGMASRPTLDRAHTFPTPPGNPGVGGMGGSDNFGWQGQAMNGAQGTNPLAIETGLSNTRSMPNTPATTPPGQPIQNMQSYHQPGQGYDNSRNMYGASASQQSPYQNANHANSDRMYGQPGSYAKNDMGPPSSRPAGPGQANEQHDAKPGNGIMPSEQSAHGHEEEGEHEHEAEYTHNSSVYDTSRSSYNYTAPSVGNLANDANINPDMTGSPGHPAASGRATPRTAAPHPSYYPQNAGYNTPPRVQQTTSSLYNVVSNDRGQANAGPGGDVYAPATDLPNPMPNGYAPQHQLMNGAGSGMKRRRDDEEDLSQSGNEGNGDLKRQRTMVETSVSAPNYDALNRPQSSVPPPRRR